MSYIGNTPTIESTEDRQVYNVADVTRQVYGIAYNDDNVSVFWNGKKLKLTDDYTTDSSGMFITLTFNPSIGDIIDCVGHLAITDIARQSFQTSKYSPTTTTTTFNAPDTQISASDKVMVYLNGALLQEGTDYNPSLSTGQIILVEAAINGDVVEVHKVIPGFRASKHFSSSDMPNHPLYSNIANNVTDHVISATDNAMAAGPYEVQGTITVNGNFTIV